VRQALEADENVGSMLLCKVVVQQHDARRIEISTVAPEATIGTSITLTWLMPAASFALWVSTCSTTSSALQKAATACARVRRPGRKWRIPNRERIFRAKSTERKYSWRRERSYRLPRSSPLLSGEEWLKTPAKRFGRYTIDTGDIKRRY
jgi:hypothetical protein